MPGEEKERERERERDPVAEREARRLMAQPVMWF